MNHFVD